MKFKFDHFNFNVFNLEKSVKFYEEAFGLIKLSEIVSKDGAFIIVFLGDGQTGFRLELTWLRDRTERYNLGDLEYHLAFHSENFEDSLRKHKEMGVVCYENLPMNCYFVTDPDGYWIEVINPLRLCSGKISGERKSLMDIDFLREFIVLTRAETFGKAAEELAISQSTLSRHIMKLESELGNVLFERTTRSLKLTRNGSRFLHYAQRVVELYDQFERKLENEKTLSEAET